MNKILFLTNKYYDPAIKKLLNKLFSCDIKTIYKIDNEILNNISKYGLENTPFNFKYQLGSFITGLDDDCNIILNCDNEDFKYQIKFLRDLNYNFESYTITKNIYKNYKLVKKINSNIDVFSYFKYVLLIKLALHLLNKIQMYIRSNIGFEINEGSFERIEKSINNNLFESENIFYIVKKYFYYMDRLKSIPLDRPRNCFNVSVISSKYIPVSLYYNYKLEKLLASKNIKVKRYIDNSKYSKLKKRFYLHKIKKYCKYDNDCNIVRNIYITKNSIKKKYDGILLINSNFDTTSISTSIILDSICKKEDIRLMNITFDENINEVKLQNSINAFYDIINLKK